MKFMAVYLFLQNKQFVKKHPEFVVTVKNNFFLEKNS